MGTMTTVIRPDSVGDEHQDEGADEGHHRQENILGSVMGHLAHILEVLGHMGDQMAGLIVVEEAEAELLQMIEHLPAHVGFDLNAQHMAEID